MLLSPLGGEEYDYCLRSSRVRHDGAAGLQVDLAFEGEAAARVGRQDHFGLLDEQAAQQGRPPGRTAAAKESDSSISGTARMLAAIRS